MPEQTAPENTLSGGFRRQSGECCENRANPNLRFFSVVFLFFVLGSSSSSDFHRSARNLDMARKNFVELNRELLEEFLKANEKRTIKNTNAWLMKKGLAIAKRLGLDEFKASTHWVYNFKLRNGLVNQKSVLIKESKSASRDARSSTNSNLGINSSPKCYQDDEPSSSKQLNEFIHHQPNLSLNNSLGSVAENEVANSSIGDNNTSLEQQMIVELSPDNIATMVTGEHQVQHQQQQLTQLEAKTVTVIKEKPPKGGSREEAIEAATTLIRYVTINTTDFDASSSSFLAKLTGYLNQLISSRQPPTVDC